MRSLVFLLCVLGLPCASPAQTNQASWETLNHLKPGQSIQVVDTSSKKHSGTLLNVSDSAISLRVASGEQSLQKQDVRSVKLLNNSHRGRNALIGAAIGGGAGAGAGAAVGAATHQGCSSTTTSFCLDIVSAGESAGILAAIGGLSGAIVGGIIGAFIPSHDTAYTTASH
jgi:hypothetical protein